MSGYIAMVRTDGPVEVGWLERMMEFMTFRGPDARNIWSQGPAGLGHAQLRTTWEDAADRQPLSLDGKRWLVADARIDGRRDLIAELRSRGRTVDEACPDSHLILAAHAVWGEQCVDHLLGDFAFVIWDTETQTLFGARDHFGLKLLYYSEVSGVLLVSNTVGALRLHPGISGEIDEHAIGDQLLFQQNLHHDRTFFRQIRQLPPAHTFVWRAGKLTAKQYWEIPVEEPLNLRQEEEYQEQFLAVFGEAVKDRLRFGRVAFSMSGGMDSTSVAALAKRADVAGRIQFKSFCMVHDRLIKDDERHFAGLAAEGIGVPISFFPTDNYPALAPSRSVVPPPCPMGPFNAILQGFIGQVAGFSPVVLTGRGADPVFYVTKVLDVRPMGRLVKYLPTVLKMACQGDRPPWGIKSRLKELFRGDPDRFHPPSFLDEEFADRMGLPERWRDVQSKLMGAHPTRPMAYGCLQHPAWWGGLGGECDAETTGLPLEYRHPFLDVRIVRYLLRVPPWPHFIHKRIMRRAMCGKLPAATLNRPKAPLVGWNTATYVSNSLERVRQLLLTLDNLVPWIDSRRLRDSVERDLLNPNLLTMLDNSAVDDSLALLSLSGWLAQTQTRI